MNVSPDDVARLVATRTIDFTTYGRRSGRPSRIEIWWFHFEDRFIITGTPGTRDWMANIKADPRVIVHAHRDFPGTAAPVAEPQFRERFFRSDVTEVRWYNSQAQLLGLVELAPMVDVALDGLAGKPPAQPGVW